MITTNDLTHSRACNILKSIVDVMEECIATMATGNLSATERDLQAFDKIEDILIKAKLV